MRFDALRTPCYVVDEALIGRNLAVLKGVADRTGCRVLLAQKAFSMFELYPMIGASLHGTAASGLFEARLGAEQMGGETHVFCPAYRPEEFDELMSLCGHVVFNSVSQLMRFGPKARAAGKSVGLRVNPECSTQSHAIYDPCAPYSRLGATRATLSAETMALVDGLHFHTLCEQDADALETTLCAVEAQFGEFLPTLSWINFGGGHHITKPQYDLARLERLVTKMRERYSLTVYLEPGEAIALNAGFLVCSVLDIVHNGMDIAILDTSAACHMPDVLEMPYHPPLMGAGAPGEKAYTCRLGGMTCLAGDIIGDYSFDKPLNAGDRLVFEDMAIYTMVKNNTFNGMALPDLVLRAPDGDCRVVRRFGYEDFKSRLS